MSPPLALVAGIGSRNRSVGKAGGLLRRVPDDLRRFAAKTIGKPEEIHIGGGPQLYDQVIHRVDRLYLTLFNDEHEGEARFPSFEEEFIEVCRHGVREHEGLEYEWVDYVRRGTSNA